MSRRIRAVPTRQALKRIHEGFGVWDPAQINWVLGQAMKEGEVSSADGDILIEHGCLLLVGGLDDNGTYVIQKAYNLAKGISGELKGRLADPSPSPWEKCEVLLPGGGAEPVLRLGAKFSGSRKIPEKVSGTHMDQFQVRPSIIGGGA